MPPTKLQIVFVLLSYYIVMYIALPQPQPQPPTPKDFMMQLTATDYKTTRFDKRHRGSELLLSREVVIAKPIEQVFDAVLTPQIWAVCYPKTIAVGGTQTHRPMQKGDLLLEKFLFAGMFYVQFRYDIEEVHRPHHVRLHGMITSSNSMMSMMDTSIMGGTFNYTFESLGSNGTAWKRELYIYSVNDDWTSLARFRLFLRMVRNSQEKDASMFVECVKVLMENKQGDDYMKELG